MINPKYFFFLGPSWLWLYGGWIYNYLCNQYLSPLTLCVRIPLRRYSIMWLSLSVTYDRSVVFSGYSNCHDITEILLKVASNTKIYPKSNSSLSTCLFVILHICGGCCDCSIINLSICSSYARELESSSSKIFYLKTEILIPT